MDGAVLLGAQGLVASFSLSIGAPGVNSWVAACLTCATAAPTTPGSG
jgi:hypothetical protein